MGRMDVTSCRQLIPHAVADDKQAPHKRLRPGGRSIMKQRRIIHPHKDGSETLRNHSQ